MTSQDASTPAAKPTVLQVLPALQSGGVERGTIEVAAALVKAGYRALIASSGGVLLSQLNYVGAEHITLPLHHKNPYHLWRNSRALAALIRKEKVDIVHARSRAPAWSAYLATQRESCPFVTTFHGIYGVTPKLKRRYNSVMVKGQTVIAISRYVREHIRTYYEVEDERIVLIPRGADVDYFDPTRVQQSRIIPLLQKWRLPDDRPIILMPGRITRWKGQEFLLEALRLLPKDSFFCVIMGEDQGHKTYRQELEDTIERYDLAGHVRIVRPITDMPAAYMLADVVVAPSLEPEAFGRVAVEAQAMGRLVVATGIGGACETVCHNETGWLIPPGDAKALADTIKPLLTLNSAARYHMGQRARKHVIDHFSVQQMCAKTLEIYDNILKNKDIKDEEVK